RQDLLPGENLRARIEVLHRASAAVAEMRAARLDPIRGGILDGDNFRLVEIPVLFPVQEGRGFAGQRAIHEHGLAVDARNAPPVMAQILDARRRYLRRLALSHAAASHASRYSVKCGRFSARRYCFRRATAASHSSGFSRPRMSS